MEEGVQSESSRMYDIEHGKGQQGSRSTREEYDPVLLALPSLAFQVCTKMYIYS